MIGLEPCPLVGVLDNEMRETWVALAHLAILAGGEKWLSWDLGGSGIRSLVGSLYKVSHTTSLVL